jgi:sensor histidine kinase YesM
VSLGQEKKYLEDLIALQKLRFTQPEKILCAIEIENENLKIPPLLFLPFIENAFKFTSKKADEPLVDVRIADNTQELLFRCQNPFDPHRKESETQGGLGLKNVKRRLEAYYKNKHTLYIEKKSDLYCVELRIEHQP